MTNRFVVHAASAVLAVATLIVASGCASKPPAEPLAVVWPDGEPSGELESNEWVSVFRDYSIALASAVNLGDFSMQLLNGSATATLVGDLYTGTWLNLYQNQDEPADKNQVEIWSGPSSFEPVFVAVNETGDQAVVRICRLDDPVFSGAQPAPTVDLSDAYLEDRSMVRDADGTIRVASDLELGDSAAFPAPLSLGVPCDGSNIRVGYFDPLPTAPSTLRLNDLVPPPGVEKK